MSESKDKYKELLDFVVLISKEQDSLLSISFYSQMAKRLLSNLDLQDKYE